MIKVTFLKDSILKIDFFMIRVRLYMPKPRKSIKNISLILILFLLSHWNVLAPKQKPLSLQLVQHCHFYCHLNIFQQSLEDRKVQDKTLS